MRVAVFCASANNVSQAFIEDSQDLGKKIGELGWELVYGGTNIGLMREVADSTLANGGEVTGIIPECIHQRGVAATGLSRLIIASDMKERKHMLRENADAFVALPGGWGTLEEITEVITLKQLGEHLKPIVFLNTARFYDGFMNFIDSIGKQGFVSAAYDHLYYVANSVEEVIKYLQDYKVGKVLSKY